MYVCIVFKICVRVFFKHAKYTKSYLIEWVNPICTSIRVRASATYLNYQCTEYFMYQSSYPILVGYARF
jgi:hypothetical protein